MVVLSGRSLGGAGRQEGGRDGWRPGRWAAMGLTRALNPKKGQRGFFKGWLSNRSYVPVC